MKYIDNHSIMILLILTILYFSSLSLQCNAFYQDSCLDSCPFDTSPRQILNGVSCMKCDLTKRLIFEPNSGKCVCSQQTFLSPSQNQCYPCHYSCLTCKGPNYNQCLTCDFQISKTFRIQLSSSCVCLPGYFDNNVLQSTTCQKCHKDCSSCTGPQDIDCIECANGRIKNQYDQCICDNQFLSNDQGDCYCPFKISRDGTCKNSKNQCPPNQQVSKLTGIAKIAKKGSPFICECILGYYRIKGICKTCGENQQYNPLTRRCQCIKNANKYKQQCIVCGSNQVFNPRQGRCSCKKNLQQTESGDCVRCPPKTIYSNGQCICVFNYYLDPRSNKCRRCTKRNQNPSCIEDVQNYDVPLSLGLEDIKNRLKADVKVYLKNPNQERKS